MIPSVLLFSPCLMPQPYIDPDKDTMNATDQGTTPDRGVTPTHYQHFPYLYLPYWMEWLEHGCIHGKYNARSKRQVEPVHHTTDKE